MSELPQVFRASDRKARKHHACLECRHAILPGDTYRYSSGIWADEPQDFKQCLNCAAIFDDANQFLDLLCDEGVGFGELRLALLDAVCRSYTMNELLHDLVVRFPEVPSSHIQALLQFDDHDAEGE